MAVSIQRPGHRVRAGAAIVGALFMLAMAEPGLVRLAAHDIPADLLAQLFVRPEGQRLHVLVRVPLAAMRDVTFPTRDGVVFLDVSDPARLDAALREAARLWIVPALTIDEDGRSLEAPTITALRASLPSDRSFGDFETARAHFREPPLPPGTAVPWNQALFDVALEYAIASERGRITIDPAVARFGLRVVTVLRFRAPDHPERAFEFIGDPGPVALDPRWHQAAWRFVRLGFDHILDGFDHLLFLFCLVLPARGLKSLAVVITAFTVAHSITLFSAAFGYAPDALWFPPLVETLIAVSIVYMALENIVLAARPEGAAGSPWWKSSVAPRRARRPAGKARRVRIFGIFERGATPPARGPRRAACARWGGAGMHRPSNAAGLAPRAALPGVSRRWTIAFGFGLVHGFGFSFALRETMQFAGAHVVTSLFAFNVGVELGQLLVVALLAPLLWLGFRFVVPQRVGIVIASALAAHTAWHWMIERGSTLAKYEWWPPSPAGLATAVRMLMVVVAIAAVRWGWMRRRAQGAPIAEAPK